MPDIKNHIKRFARLSICGVFSLALLIPTAMALPANIEAELSALNISESEFETEIGVETLYIKLQSVADRICSSGLYQAFQPDDSDELKCVANMMTTFVNTIGHDRLLAYHDRKSERAFS